ncbi:unnamed protein product [Chondrus crispus]|uniref:Uncharacterized protein n=1 Tax=Chondrus crispus TaxID=2769 RepID=R7QMQ1_CHOCR|nr:unnamed protein product [Chondrus crispus]CDF39374.1 unnamed protein product [Chondrus crispus]|eukprot:XP_005719285.1 unnamed protein product [Chondrus crispus]
MHAGVFSPTQSPCACLDLIHSARFTFQIMKPFRFRHVLFLLHMPYTSQRLRVQYIQYVQYMLHTMCAVDLTVALYGVQHYCKPTVHKPHQIVFAKHIYCNSTIAFPSHLLLVLGIPLRLLRQELPPPLQEPPVPRGHELLQPGLHVGGKQSNHIPENPRRHLCHLGRPESLAILLGLLPVEHILKRRRERLPAIHHHHLPRHIRHPLIPRDHLWRAASLRFPP